MSPGRAALPLLAWAIAGCAPTALAPTILRLDAPEPHERQLRLGLRTGPRPSAAIPSFEAQARAPASAPFEPPELGAAFEVTNGFPLGDTDTMLHVVAQAELFPPLPAPAVGLGAGLSHLFRAGRFAFAPGVSVRGSSDFGLKTSVGGPATVVSGDVSLTASVRVEDWLQVGFTPFFAASWVAPPMDRTLLQAGGVAVIRLWRFELLGGLSHAFLANGEGWDVPLVGLRVGDN